MKIAVASDHRGYQVKAKILAQISELGHDAVDFGPSCGDSVDYPDFAAAVAQAVSQGLLDRGVLICGTGTGMCIVANKFAGVRAVACHDDLTAELSRRRNDANVLCLSADLLGERLVSRVVEIWLTTEFEGGRHARRLEKIARFESQNGCPHPSAPQTLSTGRLPANGPKPPAANGPKSASPQSN